jgi:DNA-binding NtrC family response regulator
MERDMAFRALKLVTGVRGLRALQKELAAEPSLALTELKSQGMFGAYLVRDDDLECLRGAEEHFVDRKTKNEHKELSRLLLDQKRIPVVSGGYSTSGRLLQGAEALLKKAEEKGDRNIYIIGTNDEVFGELWKEAASRATPGSKARKGKRASAEGNRQAGGNSDLTNLLFELLPAGNVPDELVKTYVGKSVKAQLVRELILHAARTEDSVLILGDTGTGKEVVARAIHNYSARREHQFVPVNCGAIPRELLETELFGSMGGVATGVTTRAGLWELTGKGTLFLDEIGDLSPEHQVKILRALQERRIRRLGESREREVGARIIAATNRNLFAMVQAGRFREDLYYRLCSFLIRTPAVHEHPRDISLLAQTLWKDITRDPKHKLPQEILGRLESYRWPGNVREIKAVLSNIYSLFGKDNLGVEHLDAVYQPPQIAPDAELFEKGDEERLRTIARNYQTNDLKQENRLIGSWKGTGEDIVVPGYVELEQKHTYKLTLNLRREDGHIKGTMRAYVHERKSANTARVELISISENYFTFQYLLTNPDSSHYGVMMLQLLGIGNQMKGFFLTKKVFESKIGFGTMCFKKGKD